MKKNYLLIIGFAILILFIIQSAGTLVESIYILDLMNSSLDAKALGVLFFFTPLLMLPFIKRYPRPLMWALTLVLFIGRGLFPYLGTSTRLIAAGIATGAAMSLLFLLIATRQQAARPASAGLALAVALSVLLRTAGHGIDYSLTIYGGWLGWLMGFGLGMTLFFHDLTAEKPMQLEYGGNPTLPVLGIYLVLTLVYFSVSAPAVIVRWTETNYTLVVAAVSLLSLVYVGIAVNRASLLERISPRLTTAWNILFTISLTLTLLAQRVPFPASLDSAPVMVGSPTIWQIIPLASMLLLFPVLFLDLQVFIQRWQSSNQPGRSLAPGIILGSFSLILLIFINIFSNVWGYIKPISPPFRNTFWLAYFILSAGITLLAWQAARAKPPEEKEAEEGYSWAWSLVLTATFVATVVFALPGRRVTVDTSNMTTLRVMTMNTQESNDALAQRSYQEQLALIQQVSPDILALQETDSTRISLNNNDYVRYFADQLGYYSYYGPRTPSGTYGTAILSKLPLQNTQTAFMYSDKDETGVAEAEVEIGGIPIAIYDVHPDSSDPAMVAFAHTLLTQALAHPYAIAMGDYNLRDYEEAYKVIDSSLVNAWTSVYPSKISTDGVDMSGDNRIDHIFMTPNLKAVNPIYILPPASATDHPVHWTDITWNK
jgi:endonuclease/exonuclease/phosphatase family metal-dependent hydrolase